MCSEINEWISDIFYDGSFNCIWSTGPYNQPPKDLIEAEIRLVSLYEKYKVASLEYKNAIVRRKKRQISEDFR